MGLLALLALVAQVDIALANTVVGQATAPERPAIFAQLGHSASVHAIAFSPDGKVLASGGMDGVVKTWDLASGRELRTIRADSTAFALSVQALAFAPDGKSIAGAIGGEVKVWDAATGRDLRHMTHDASPINAAVFAPDGKTLAGGGGDRLVTLWDVATGRPVRTMAGHTRMVTSVAISPDGRLIASGSSDHDIRIWSMATGGLLHILIGHDADVLSVAFSRDGKSLVSAGGDNTVRLWDVAGGRQRLKLAADHFGLRSAGFSPDGRVIASNGAEGVRLWDAVTGAVAGVLTSDSHNESALAFSPDGRWLASGRYMSNAVSVWDLGARRLSRVLKGNVSPVWAVRFDRQGASISALRSNHRLEAWDPATGELHASLGFDYESPTPALAFSPDDRLAAWGDSANRLRVWSVATQREALVLEGHQAWIDAVAFSADGKTLASADANGTIRLWSAADGRPGRVLTGHDGPVKSIAFSPDGAALASVGADNTLRLWNVASGRQTRAMPIFLGGQVAFSPDGATVAADSSDHGGVAIGLWDVGSGRQRLTMGSPNPTTAMVFSPDGQTIATASLDHGVRLWNVATGELKHLLTGHGGAVSSVAFSPDGRTVASGSWDGTVRAWDAATGQERAALAAFDDGGAIAVTPEGFFRSSSEAAEEALDVRVGDRVFGISSFRESFYRPDLVQRRLAGESLAALGGMESVKLSPLVEIQAPSPATGGALAVKIRVTDVGGGVGPIRLFVDGVVVLQDDRPRVDTGARWRSYSLPAAGGADRLRATVENAAGDMWSEAGVEVDGAPIPVARAAAPRGTLHALVVGIEDFPRMPWNHLRFPVADANLVADTLRAKAAPLFDKVEVTVLATPKETEKASILAALAAMRARIRPEDAFVFYAASHGLVADGDYLMITSNVGAHPGHIAADTLTRRELTGLLANIPTTRKVAFIDTCYAGGLDSLSTDVLATRGMDPETAATIIGREIGLTLLMASTSEQHANEGYQKHGLFTWVLDQGLNGAAAAPGGEVVDSTALARYVDSQTPPLALRIYRTPQQPVTNESGKAVVLTRVASP